MLRCTEKLRKRLGPHARVEGPENPPGRLGDWTGTFTVLGREHLVIAISHVTLLPVVLPLAPIRNLVTRLPEALFEVLAGLGVHPSAIAAEVTALTNPLVGPTNDRRVLGSLNDFVRMVDTDDGPLVFASLKLARAPCGPIGMDSPDDRTRALLA